MIAMTPFRRYNVRTKQGEIIHIVMHRDLYAEYELEITERIIIICNW